MDRSHYRTRLLRGSDVGDRAYLMSLGADERVAMVWTLTLQAWAFKEGLDTEPRLRRDVARVVRRGR